MTVKPVSEPRASLRVVVVDDHDLLREGVSAVIASYDDLDVVGEARNGETAIDTVAELQPDVVVMDVVMPGMGGIEAIRRLRATNDVLGIVALSSFSEGAQVRAAIDAGATGYLVKSVDGESLARAVRSAAEGTATFSPEITLALISRGSSAQVASLTARELDIADLVASGKTNAEIAAALVLSVFTVKNHVSSILMKLDVRTRTEAAAVLLSRQ
jgi:NarL family two-component system response regulator LiaR